MKLLITLALFAGIADAQSKTTPITGVWKIVEASTPDNGVKRTQGGIYIFTGKYFSKFWDRSESPRPELTPEMPDAELRKNVRAVLTKAGTYEVSGTTLTTHSKMAINPRSARPDDSDIYSFRIEGNTMWITDVNELGQPSKNPVTLKFIRLE